ncbi:hypothetical protein [Phytohabitans suffuscus]|uniref:Uncharacterized protein n=1 Tax=Phytohabitans suffuscus TaxID=624315 RepID=A0A6F8YRX4_9ACTN|nr:hypothetical protein Psuf_061650 [Phytohabitans suffuscus]
MHAAADIVVPGKDHINPAVWKPLIYNFRHYYTLGKELGYSRRSETTPDPLDPLRENAGADNIDNVSHANGDADPARRGRRSAR